MKGAAKHLISIDDLTDTDLDFIVDRGVSFATGDLDYGKPLAGLIVGVYFRLTSTRTRAAFSAAAHRLGADVINFGPDDLQTNTGESGADTGRVFSLMLDAVVARTGGETEELRGWATQRRMAVINAMSAAEHPTQALADLTTLRRHFGDLGGLRVLYIGEGNNTATALALALSRIPGVEVEFRTPPGYGIPPEVMARARSAARRGTSLVEIQGMASRPSGFDVIYTTRWRTTGTNKSDPNWGAIFEPFRVTTAFWQQNPKATFMHDLPAHRGEEVSAEVIDGPRSIVFHQAENKLHSAMAVLEWCMDGAASDLPERVADNENDGRIHR
jgi:ornithine carbamoyltransferase